MKKIYLLIMIMLGVIAGYGQTSLSAGDIAITGINMDNPDEFSIVFIAGIENGTVIKFTDNGWQSSGSFRNGEGTLEWTASQAYSAGSEIIISSVGSIAFSVSGDQLLVYQGDDSNPTFITALNSEGSHVWQSNATSTNTSAIPSGLTNGIDCVALIETDNIIYNRSVTTGSKEDILSAINNYNNWTGSNSSRQTLSNSGYTINSETPGLWTGATSSVWNLAGNWDDNQIPTGTTNVTIPNGATNNPTISAAAECNDLTIESGASLIGGDNLTINGTFTMQRTIDNINNWHLISSPVSNQVIVGSDFVPEPSGSPTSTLPTTFDFYSCQESATDKPWINIRADGEIVNSSFETSFTNGKGYLVAYNSEYSNTNFEYTGTMNSGNIETETLTYSASPALQGANLIGNPYPSAINWSSASKGQFADEYAYIYNASKEGGAGYEAVNGIISPNQGFFVELNSKNTGEKFQFTPAIQTHDGAFMKSGEIDDKLVLRFGNDSFYDEVDFILNEKSNMNRDRKDAVKFFSYNPEIPQVYAVTSDLKNVALNSFRDISDNTTIPICIYVPSERVYSLNLVSLTGEFSGQSVYVEDLKENQTIKISERSEYSFSARPSDSPNRFIIHFSPVGTDEISQVEDIRIFSTNNSITLLNNSNAKGEVSVVNIMGQEIASYILNGNSKQQISIEANSGVYIVNVRTSNGNVVSEKVIITK